jgi:hypothetical protein
MSKVSLDGKKLLISTPVMDGKVPTEWMLAFTTTVVDGNKYGVQVGIETFGGCSLIVQARNEIVHNFLFSTDFDYLLCIDADVIWNPEDVFHMLSKIDAHGAIFGAYPVKQEEPRFDLRLKSEDNKPIISEGLLQLRAAPAGFMMLTRKALMDVYNRYTDLHYTGGRSYLNKDHKVCSMFNTMIVDDELCGEDIAFCFRLVASGCKLWVDPEIELIHVGTKKYAHSYKEYLEADAD